MNAEKDLSSGGAKYGKTDPYEGKPKTHTTKTENFVFKKLPNNSVCKTNPL